MLDSRALGGRTSAVRVRGARETAGTAGAVGAATRRGEREKSAAELPSLETRVTAGMLRRHFPWAFRPRRAVYWVDLGLSAALGWSAFAFAGLGEGPLAWAAGGVAVLALYRAVLFIHEIAHLPPGAVPGLTPAWDLAVGFPLAVPSLMYAGSHGDHHRVGTYGTPEDPEYLPLAHWHPLRIAGASLVVPLVPALLVLRWGVLGPLSRVIPALRRLVVERASTLAINGAYRRPQPRGRERRRWALEEAGAAATVWAGAAAVASGAVAPGWVGLWYGVGTGILLLNHLRTLAAHRYANDAGALDRQEELVDSVNLAGDGIATVLAAPLGLRFHALHHLAPMLPYHSLGAVHRALSRTLAPEAPYRRTVEPGMRTVLAALLGGRGGLSAARPGAAAARAPASRAARDGDAGARSPAP